MKQARYRYVFCLLLLSSLLVACGHTNHLAQYNPRAGRMVFYHRAIGNGDAEATIWSPGAGFWGAFVAEVGSTAAEDEARAKIQHATNPDSLALHASLGVERAAQLFLHAQLVPDSLASSAQYVVETELREYHLSSGSSGVYAEVSVLARILCQQDGAVVWEDHEHYSIAIRESPFAFGPPRWRSVESVFNAARLAELPEWEIAKVLNGAAEEAGRQLGETLRRDAAEIPIVTTGL